ncbi:DNA-packaging protein FI [Citrobacter freundii complex sp. 2024EL-00238]|uniref:DNA-packaging protein FI n=1 Tax=Citrobacter freundii complex TaxID=1344959 RepID=UPI0028A39532|nr:DNA-packaging protein [Citrobacter freundii]HBV0977929.1 DNA-packaging protein [Citrobacter freundii]
MTEKEKLIARLNELGVKLNREVSTSGTIQELTMRIAELEEELEEGEEVIDDEAGARNDADSTDDGAGSNGENTSEDDAGASAATGDLVCVETLATLHIDALHATRDERVTIVEPGVFIRVSDQDADLLIAQGLVREA